VSSPNLKCPACSKTLDESEFHDAAEQLENSISKRSVEESRKRKQEFDNKILELKVTHKKDLLEAAKKNDVERKSLQKKFDDQISKSKEIREREIREAKKNYQMQLEDIRSIYQSQLDEMKKTYEQMASSSQTQIDKLQKWLHEELVDAPFAKIAKIEQEKKSAENQIGDLVQQLNDKNSEVIFLEEKMKQLKDKVPLEETERVVEEHKMDSKYQNMPEESDDSQQKEWLDMIKELAHQHEMRGGEMEDVELKSEEQEKTWGSKVAKKFGLF